MTSAVNLGIFTSDLHHLKSDIQVIREMATCRSVSFGFDCHGENLLPPTSTYNNISATRHVQEPALVVEFRRRSAV